MYSLGAAMGFVLLLPAQAFWRSNDSNASGFELSVTDFTSPWSRSEFRSSAKPSIIDILLGSLQPTFDASDEVEVMIDSSGSGQLGLLDISGGVPLPGTQRPGLVALVAFQRASPGITAWTAVLGFGSVTSLVSYGNMSQMSLGNEDICIFGSGVQENG